MIAAVLLTVVLMAGAEPAPMVAPAAHAAGCHGHGTKAPASTPVSYRCCQLGHNSAIPQSSLAPLNLFGSSAAGGLRPAPILIAMQASPRGLTILSPDPPHTIPLRV